MSINMFVSSNDSQSLSRLCVSLSKLFFSFSRGATCWGRFFLAGENFFLERINFPFRKNEFFLWLQTRFPGRLKSPSNPPPTSFSRQLHLPITQNKKITAEKEKKNRICVISLRVFNCHPLNLIGLVWTCEDKRRRKICNRRKKN